MRILEFVPQCVRHFHQSLVCAIRKIFFIFSKMDVAFQQMHTGVDKTKMASEVLSIALQLFSDYFANVIVFQIFKLLLCCINLDLQIA